MIDNFIYGKKEELTLSKILFPTKNKIKNPYSITLLYRFKYYSPFFTNRIIFVPQLLQTPDIALLPLEVVILFAFTISLLARHFTQ